MLQVTNDCSSSFERDISVFRDLDSNKIRHLHSGSVKMKTEMLNLDFNLIRTIEGRAFEGSEIAKLSLKGNTQLHSIHEDAFSGLKNVRTLDLSETSINYLPVKGLEELDVLKLTEVYPLKVFPSVYHFKYIKEAYLTYPYHCCAFKFPATHDPEEFSKYIDFKKNMENLYCRQNPSTTPTTWLALDAEKNVRRKRRLHQILENSFEPPIDKIRKYAPLVNSRAYYSTKGENHVGTVQFPRRGARGSLSFVKERHKKHKGHVKLLRGARMVKRNDFHFRERGVPVSRDSQSIAEDRQDWVRRTAEWGSIPKSEINIHQDILLNSSDAEEFFGNQITTKKRKPKVQKNFPENPFMEGVFHGTTVAVISEFELQAFCGQLAKNYRDVECYPTPDAFNPCEDVMGNMMLRAFVWVVVGTSILGNVAVMVVLMSTGACKSVSKFLMCNLAFADFCMGVYLLLIAAMDLHSMGTYFNYAIDWQHGIGCKIAGFLTVLATELSIYTLTVISIERWYAITYAINLSKRLKLRRAAKIMSAGWLFALTMASLPLINVNGYSRTSICLPMKSETTSDIIYLLILLGTNSLTFIFIFFCYGNMYISVIRHQSRATANDMAVAKRMAMLVITDFLCWAPVAFFATTAVAGYPLIDVTKSKILLVFFYPLNSCANPFLYAIFTTQYRRDFLILLKRCEGFLERTSKNDKNSSCNVPPLQFSSDIKYWKNSCSSHLSTDNSMKVLRPSDLSSQQDVFSTSGWEDPEAEDVIQLWSCMKDSSSSDDSGQCCKNYSSSSHSTTTHRGSPHPVKNRFVHVDRTNILDVCDIRSTSM
ncbi:lutropin-choriogonadotropic hormone receptor-like [Uloborus diversus]|uniref:lutropin-choriogonadotropic hormone receptor-like n=1 Tax=Uloborus diversus TaxID=327109 RepID=UPI0024099A13|nr:lutropin-choriogonadotropic hormone receptor-like [Uloborus diversus]